MWTSFRSTWASAPASPKKKDLPADTTNLLERSARQLLTDIVNREVAGYVHPISACGLFSPDGNCFAKWPRSFSVTPNEVRSLRALIMRSPEDMGLGTKIQDEEAWLGVLMTHMAAPLARIVLSFLGSGVIVGGDAFVFLSGTTGREVLAVRSHTLPPPIGVMVWVAGPDSRPSWQRRESSTLTEDEYLLICMAESNMNTSRCEVGLVVEHSRNPFTVRTG